MEFNMKSSFLVSLKEKLASKSSTPWACFETDGISPQGLGISMRWNEAFIEHLHSQGIAGSNDNETIQLFFLFMSGKIAESIDGASDDGQINPQATPNLTSEANRFVG
jgi:hypothetical protein